MQKYNMVSNFYCTKGPALSFQGSWGRSTPVLGWLDKILAASIGHPYLLEPSRGPARYNTFTALSAKSPRNSIL